jgi:hypothetical protein
MPRLNLTNTFNLPLALGGTVRFRTSVLLPATVKQ